MENKIRKNLLDLNYQKYLQYRNTSIILLFTYFIGIAIAFGTNQIKYSNTNQILLISLISITIIPAICMPLLYFRFMMAKILKEVEELGIS